MAGYYAGFAANLLSFDVHQLNQDSRLISLRLCREWRCLAQAAVGFCDWRERAILDRPAKGVQARAELS